MEVVCGFETTAERTRESPMPSRKIERESVPDPDEVEHTHEGYPRINDLKL